MDTQSADNFLIKDYDFFQKGFELWASHFMTVFYLWTGVLVAPVTVVAVFLNFRVAKFIHR